MQDTLSRRRLPSGGGSHPPPRFAQAPRHRPAAPRHAAARRRSKRWLWIVPVALLIAVVSWVGVRGLLARADLEEAQALVGELQEHASTFDLERIGPLYTSIQERTASARALTSDPIWRAVEVIPYLGQNFRAVREVAAVTDDTIIALEPLARFAATLDPAALAPVDGAIPLDVLDTVSPLVVEAASAISVLSDRAAAIDVDGTLGPVSDARDRVASLLDRASDPLATAAELVPLVPGLLGADGPRTYVVMFQNNAEARSLGGTALSFAVMSIDQGKFDLVETVPAAYGNFPVFDVSPVPVPDGFDAVFPAAFGQFIANATLRPSFPSAAEITVQNWLSIRGYAPDGVVSIDAVALSFLLRATGPISLSTGDTLATEDAVTFLLNRVPQRYNSGDVNADNRAQDVVYDEAISRTFDALSGGAFEVPKLLSAVRQGFAERRFTYWDADPAVQSLISDAGLDNGLPESTPSTDAVGLFINDNVGSKLSYFLRAAVETSSAQCDAEQTVHRVFTTFTNLIPAGGEATISPSILGQYEREGVAPGVERVLVLVYTPPGTMVLSAAVDGAPVEVVSLHDTDRPVVRLVALVPPGGGATISVDLLMAEPGSRSLDLRVTPLVGVTPVEQLPLDCATVALPVAG